MKYKKPSPPRSARGRYAETRLAKLPDRLSPALRPFADRTFRSCRLRGLKIRSLEHYADALLNIHEYFPGRDPVTITPDEWEEFNLHLRDQYAPATAHCRLLCIRRALKDNLRVRKLPDDLAEALAMKDPKPPSDGLVLRPHEFRRLLERAAECYPTSRYARDILQALLWFLWDTGFRVNEALGLRVGDIRFDDAGFTATLRPNQPDLKTGPRAVYCVEARGALEAWIGIHPRRHDASAPLFLGFRDLTGTKRLRYKVFRHVLIRVDAESGLLATRSEPRPLRAHDFRHTCATRKAKLGWNESQLRQYFGWSPGSDMPSRYVHLALGDMREQVRRDAGIDEYGLPDTRKARDEVGRLQPAMARLIDPAPPECRGSHGTPRSRCEWSREQARGPPV